MDDWQVGDLALCVGIDDEPGTIEVAFDLAVGGVYTVCEVCSEPADIYGSDWTGLNFEEDFSRDASSAWDAKFFRKIKPLTDEERDSFLADLDAPVSPAVPDGRRPVTAQRGTGHLSPASALLASLPDPSAAHTPCLADGSGLSDHVAAHAATANN